MAKRRTSGGGRKKRKAANFNQPVHRKRSQRRSDRFKWTEKEFPAENAVEDLSRLANQFARTLEGYAHPSGAGLPTSERQQIRDLPRSAPIEQSQRMIQVLNRELLNHFIEQGQRIFQAMGALVGSRSPQDFFRVQFDLAKANVNSLLEAASRILVIMIEMTTEAIRLHQLGRSPSVVGRT